MQSSFSELEYAAKKKVTRRDRFLTEIEAITPWAELERTVAPFYPSSGGRGRPPIGVLRMLRMYVAQQCFGLSDEGIEDALYDSQSIRRFVGIDLSRESAPDATTLLKFRRLLESHQLTESIFNAINAHLAKKGMLLREGTIVDATLIAAPPSTKNQDKARDPEMHQTKKGKDWHFGMKLHIGADSKTGLVHSASVTAANVHDSHEVPNLLHGQETRLYGDSAYRGKAQRERLRELAPKAKDFTNKRAYKNRPLTEADKATNRRKSSIRSKVEHPFLTLKRLWGFAKVRYRGLAKNANRAFAMLAMLNIKQWGRSLTGEVCPA